MDNFVSDDISRRRIYGGWIWIIIQSCKSVDVYWDIAGHQRAAIWCDNVRGVTTPLCINGTRRGLLWCLTLPPVTPDLGMHTRIRRNKNVSPYTCRLINAGSLSDWVVARDGRQLEILILLFEDIQACQYICIYMYYISNICMYTCTCMYTPTCWSFV